MERRGTEEISVERGVIERIREVQGQEQGGTIERSHYNEKYGRMTAAKVSKRQKRTKDIQVIASFRSENEERVSCY